MRRIEYQWNKRTADCEHSLVVTGGLMVMDMTKTQNGLENGLTNGLEGACLKCSFGHRNPLYSEHTT